MRTYVALLENGTRVIEVPADDSGEAVERIRYELTKNPSRQAYLRKWEEGGMRVMRELRLEQMVVDPLTGEIVGREGATIDSRMIALAAMQDWRWCPTCGTLASWHGEFSAETDVFAKCDKCGCETEDLSEALEANLCICDCGKLLWAKDVTGPGDEFYECNRCGRQYWVDWLGQREEVEKEHVG